MFEIYAFCRAVDDIADDPGPRDDAAAPRWSAGAAISRRSMAAWPPPHLSGLAQAVRNFDLAHGDFLAVIAGMEMDVVADIRAPDMATLDLYCDRVACAVGRLSVRVFGMDRDAGLALAHHLGRALQLTNILRDLDEDAAMGRLYLPREALRDAGIISTDPATVLANPMLGEACATLVDAGESRVRRSRQPSWRNARGVRCGRRASWRQAYRLILDQLIARGFAPPRAAGAFAARQDYF